MDLTILSPARCISLLLKQDRITVAIDSDTINLHKFESCAARTLSWQLRVLHYEHCVTRSVFCDLRYLNAAVLTLELSKARTCACETMPISTATVQAQNFLQIAPWSRPTTTAHTLTSGIIASPVLSAHTITTPDIQLTQLAAVS